MAADVARSELRFDAQSKGMFQRLEKARPTDYADYEQGLMVQRELKRNAEQSARWAAARRKRRQQLERAAGYPWLPVELDPPEPN